MREKLQHYVKSSSTIMWWQQIYSGTYFLGRKLRNTLATR